MAENNMEGIVWFGKDSVVRDGRITAPSHVKIAGMVQMNIESAGKVVVADTGKVEGDIKASEVIVHGEVGGDIIAQQRLTIHKNSLVKGHIFSKKLVIEEGASCNFDVAVGEDINPVQKYEVEHASASGRSINERHPNGQQTNGHQPNGVQSSEHQTNGHQPKGQPTSGEQSNELQSSAKPTNSHQSNGVQSSEHQTNGHQSDQKVEHVEPFW